MTPKNGREWGFLCGGVIIAAVVLFLFGARYSVIGEGGFVWRLDRWTGQVVPCQCGGK
jgi:hypothetical protein